MSVDMQYIASIIGAISVIIFIAGFVVDTRGLGLPTEAITIVMTIQLIALIVGFISLLFLLNELDVSQLIECETTIINDVEYVPIDCIEP